jgi:uncharacterized protein with GYD domain
MYSLLALNGPVECHTLRIKGQTGGVVDLSTKNETGLREESGYCFFGMWFAFGEYDLVLISQLPDNSSIAAISMAISSGDSVKAVKTTPLMTMDEVIEVMKKAAKAGYKPPQAIVIWIRDLHDMMYMSTNDC